MLDPILIFQNNLLNGVSETLIILLCLFSITVYCTNQTISLTDTTTIVDIISPFYPSYYPPLVDCFWRITIEEFKDSQSEGANTGFIIVHFDTVSLSFRHDYLTVGVGDDVMDSTIILRLTGTGGPRLTSVNDSSIWLRLTTDPWGQLEFGFNLRIHWEDFAGKVGTGYHIFKEAHRML